MKAKLLPGELPQDYLPKWERIREQGKWRFVVLRGVLFLGGLIFLAGSAVSWIAGFHDFWVRQVFVSVLAGFVLGLFAWHRAERAYRRWKGLSIRETV